MLSTYRLLFVHNTNFQYKIFLSSLYMAHLALCPGHPPIFHTFYHSHYCKLGGGMRTMLKLVHNCFNISLIPRPSACPADLWKNRVWTLSLQKLGQVYLQQSSATSSICFGSVMMHSLPEQSDWCDNMPIRSYNYTPVLLVNVSRPYFLTRLQGMRKKFGVWGGDYFNITYPCTPLLSLAWFV